ncbi:DUF2975 domain-containing protein [Nocardia sp. NPDC056000]|uniref:DUF2975 domain-containing protein n=1 Tax=Nocardia sp. NPDC056000 TaxID=3345674 RepID=UPI0035D57A68
MSLPTASTIGREGVAIGLLIMFIASVIAAGAALFVRIVQHGVDLKTENDLTV